MGTESIIELLSIVACVVILFGSLLFIADSVIKLIKFYRPPEQDKKKVFIITSARTRDSEDEEWRELTAEEIQSMNIKIEEVVR